MNRREFIKTSTGYAAYAALGMAVPGMFNKAAAAEAPGDIPAMNETAQAVAAGNLDEAERQLSRMLAADVDAWQIHLSLFAVVQRVLNPPYINPHLPKMYAIYRYFIPYLTPDEISALVRIEISECTRRPKLEELPLNKEFLSPVSSKDCEAAIGDQDWEKTTVLLAAFHAQTRGRAAGPSAFTAWQRVSGPYVGALDILHSVYSAGDVAAPGFGSMAGAGTAGLLLLQGSILPNVSIAEIQYALFGGKTALPPVAGVQRTRYRKSASHDHNLRPGTCTSIFQPGRIFPLDQHVD